MESEKDYVSRIFNLARMQGVCRTQGEFAQLLGMNHSTISKALQGDEKYLTANLVKRVKVWAAQVLTPGNAPSATVEDKRPDIIIPAATMDLYTAMAKSIDRLTALVDRLAPDGAKDLPSPPPYSGDTSAMRPKPIQVLMKDIGVK